MMEQHEDDDRPDHGHPADVPLTNIMVSDDEMEPVNPAAAYVDDLEDASVVSGARSTTRALWWMDFMKQEGLLDADTKTVISSTTEKKTVAAADSDQLFLAGKDTEALAREDEGEAEKKEDTLDDSSHHDEKDQADSTTESDWRERLWVAARSHWKDTQGSSPEDAEVAILSSRNDLDDQDKIDAFHRKLTICLEAYVQVFGDIENRKKETEGDASQLAVEAMKLSHYVPFRVARRLFHVVLLELEVQDELDKQALVDSEKEPEEVSIGTQRESAETIRSRKQKDAAFLFIASHVTQVLLSPEVGIFRTYMVEACDPTVNGTTETAFGVARRVRTDRISEDRRQFHDTEQLLYGDMQVEEKREEPEDTKEPEVDDDDIDIDDGDAGEEHEEEVRMKTEVSQSIKAEHKSSNRADWRLPFLRGVILNGILKDSLVNDRFASNVLAPNVDKRSETSLAYMYSIRYFPHFYLRANWSQRASERLDRDTFSYLMRYFSDARLIRNRLVVLGVCNGVTVHVSELNSLFSELKHRFEGVQDRDELYREVHRSVSECLGAILQEKMQSIGFYPNKTDTGTVWKSREPNGSVALQDHHPQVMSVCLEIGRSFQLQGVTLGQREQELLEARRAGDGRSFEAALPVLNFDDDMTELEVSAYLSAQSAFEGSANVLATAEGFLRSNHQPQLPDEPIRDGELNPAELRYPKQREQEEKAFQTALQHIVQARATIELYLADTLTTLGYCYEAKLSDMSQALAAYRESLAFYSLHVDRNHPTVIHTLRSVGSVHLALHQNKEALACLGECLAHVKKDVEPEIAGMDGASQGQQSMGSKQEVADILKLMGVVQMQLGNFDDSFALFSEAIDLVKGESEDPTVEQFRCDLMAKMVFVLFAKLDHIKGNHSRRRLAMVYGEDERFDPAAFDAMRLARLQVERQAVDLARDTVSLRSRILDVPQMDVEVDDSVLSTIRKRKVSDNSARLRWYEVVEYAKDLLGLGKLYFRRRDYADALKVWKEASYFLSQGSDPDGSLYEELSSGQAFSRVMQDAASKLNLERINLMAEVLYLSGVASCRVKDTEGAIAQFEKAISFLEQKRKTLSERSSTLEEDWEVLDLDVGYCEHALGLANFYSEQYTPATSHYREALRLFEAVAARRKARLSSQNRGQRFRDESYENMDRPREQLQNDEKKGDLDISVNSAIASVMMSLGALYHEQRKTDRAQRFLEGSIQIIQSTTNKVLLVDRDPNRNIKSTTGFNDLSIVLSVVRVGDAHRRIALLHLDRRNVTDARLAFETAMKFLESTSLEARLTLCVDDEKHLESVSDEDISDMLIVCYETMMNILDQSEERVNRSATQNTSWFGFGSKPQVDEEEEDIRASQLTREDLLFRLGNIHAKQSSYDSAIDCFHESRDLTGERLGTGEHRIIGNIMFNLGNVFKSIFEEDGLRRDMEARNQAIDAFDESLRIARIVSGPEAIAAAEVMESLATLLLGHENDLDSDEEMSDDEAEAMKLLQEALSIRRMHRADTNLAAARSAHVLGVLCMKQVREFERGTEPQAENRLLSEAAANFSQAVRVRKLLLGDHLEAANSAYYLGLALRRRIGEKRPSNEEALRHLSSGLYIRNTFLDRSLREARRTGKAASRRTWDIALDGTRDIHDVVVKTLEIMYEIAGCHEVLESHPMSRMCLTDALDLLEYWIQEGASENWYENNSVSRISTRTATEWRAKILHKIGESWFGEQNFRQAASDFEQSLRLRGVDPEGTGSPDEIFDNFFRQQSSKTNTPNIHARHCALTMEKLAVCLDKTGHRDDALRCYMFSLKAYGEQFGDESLQVAEVLKRAGSVYQDGHDYKRCVRALQRALHIRDMFEQTDSTSNMEDALVFVRLARALLAIGAYDQVALDHFYSAVGMLEEFNAESGGPNQVQNQFKKITVKSRDQDKSALELILECHSSILVLIRRGGTDIPADEESISEVLHKIGNTQAALGKHEKARKSLENVLKFQQRINGDDHLNVADLFFNLGNVYIELGDVEKARECHQECHRITSVALGEESVELAENMICMGNVEHLCNNHAIAIEWFDDALRVLRSRRESEASVCKVLQKKAISLDKLGEYNQSIECFGDVLRLGRRMWGADHIELSHILNALGNVHRNQGELRRSLRCYEESLRIRSLSKDELAVANTQNNIGAVFASMEEVNRAKQFYADALQAKTRLLGGEHLDTARTLYNMGQLYVSDKNMRSALLFLEESLRVFRGKLGEHHNEVASCLCSIGTVHDEQGHEDMALNFFKRALNSVKGQGGSRAVRSQALHNVGIILTKRNDVDHAVRIFREALEMKSNSLDAVDKSDTEYSLANVLRLTGCVVEALEYHKHALDSRIHVLGRSHPTVADSLFGLAQTLVDNNQHNDALGVLRQCHRIRQASLGQDDGRVADSAFLLGIVLREVGFVSESFSMLKHAYEIKELSSGKESLELADVAFKLGIVLVELGKYDEARSYVAKTFHTRRDKLGDVHPEVATAMENLGIIDQKDGRHEEAIEWLKKALDMKRLSVGDSHEDISAIVHSMALSILELEDLESANQLFEEAVRRKKTTFGLKHIEVARVLVDQGRALEQIDELEGSLMAYEEAVDTDCFEDNSWEIGRVFMRMGLAHFALEKAEDAWDCFSEATRVFELIDRREKRRRDKDGSVKDRPTTDLRDLIRCYECMLRLSEMNPNRYNVDRSLVLPKIAHVLVELKLFEKATALYKDAVILQKSLPGDTRFVVATNLHNLGNCLHNLGDVEEALICLEDALGLFQEIPGVEGKHVSDTYHSLGVVHQTRSELQEALACYSNALKSRQKAVDAKTDLIATLSNMGEVLRGLGMFDASLKSCKDALRLVDTKQDSSILLVAKIVDCIGSCQRDRFEYEKSLRCYTECLKQRKEAPGQHDFLVARTLHEIGTIHQLQGRKEEAQSAFSEAIEALHFYLGTGDEDGEITSKARMTNLTEGLKDFVDDLEGVNPLEGAEAIVLLGYLLEATDLLDEAIVCHEVAIKLSTEAFGEDHLLTAESKNRVGVIRFKLGDYDRATPRLRDALQVRRQRLGDKHAHTEEVVKTLARCYAAKGDSETALTYFREVMKKDRSISKDVEGEADLLLRLGKLHEEQGEHKEALACFRDSLKVQRQGATEADEFKLGDTLRCMGSAMIFLGQLREARIALLSALKILEETGDDLSEEILGTIFLLGRVNEEEAAFDKAMAWYEKSLRIVDGREDDMVLMRAKVTYRLGSVKFSTGELEEAMMLSTEAKELFLEAVGPNHVDHAACVHSIGLMHFSCKEFDKAKSCFTTSLTIRQQHLGARGELGDSLHYLGATLLEMDQLGTAQKCLEDALNLRRRDKGTSEDDLGQTFRCLAQVEDKLGMAAEALSHFQEAIRIGMVSNASFQQIADEEYESLSLCFERAISITKHEDQKPEVLGKLFHQQGSLQSKKHNYRKAMSSFTEAIQFYKMVYGEEHLTVANALFNVGVCLKETGDGDRAMKCLTRALSSTKYHLGEDHTDVADTLQQMAEVYNMKGDIRGALKMCEQALQIRRYKEDLPLASLLDFTGELCCACKDSDEAERSFRECVRIRRKVHGGDHVDVSMALFSLGKVYENFRRDHKRSLKCYEEALRIRKMLGDDDTIDSAKCFLHLGNVHGSMNNHGKSAFCFAQARGICFRSSEPNHEVIEDALIGHGQALVSKGKLDEALQQFDEAREVRVIRDSKPESEGVAAILVFKADVLFLQGNHEAAFDLLHSTLDMYKITVGIEHVGTSSCFQKMAELYMQVNDNDEALVHAQQSLKIRKNLLSKNDELVGDSYFVIAKILMGRRDYDTAKPCLDAALDIFRHRRGPTDPSIGETMYCLGLINEARQEWEEAVTNFQGVLQVRQKAGGRDDSQLAQSLDHLGKAHMHLEQFDLGADCFNECLRIQTQVHGQDSLEVADVLYQLGAALKEAEQGESKMDPAQCLADAIRIYRQILGENEIPVAKCLSRLGGVLASKQQQNKASGCFERSISIFQGILREDVRREEMEGYEDEYEAYASALLDFAKFLDSSGQDGSAMKTYRRALKLYQALRGKGSDIIDTTLCSIANVLGRQERFQEAMQLFGEVLKRRVAVLGDHHPMVADVYFGMAMLYEKKRDFGLAMSSLEKCVRIRRATIGPWSAPVAEALTRIGMIHRYKEDFAAALQSWNEALAIYKKSGLSDNDHAIASLLKQQATLKAILDNE